MVRRREIVGAEVEFHRKFPMLKLILVLHQGIKFPKGTTTVVNLQIVGHQCVIGQGVNGAMPESLKLNTQAKPGPVIRSRPSGVGAIKAKGLKPVRCWKTLLRRFNQWWAL